MAVRLIGPEQGDEEGQQMGVVPIEKALTLAEEAELDLVEVSPKAMPPVCKIMDYGKYVYRVNKAEQKQKANQHKTEVKGVRLGFNTGQHDIEIKLKQARGFIEKRDLVKVSLVMRGRETAYRDLAMKKMHDFADALKDIAVVDLRPKMQGYQINMVLKPL